MPPGTLLPAGPWLLPATPAADSTVLAAHLLTGMMAAARAASRLLKASCRRCEREQPRVDKRDVSGRHGSPTRAT